MRSLDKKQPAEDNLSLEPWVLGGRVDLLDGGRGTCLRVAFSFVAVCLCRFITALFYGLTLVTTVTHTELSRQSPHSGPG